AAAKGLEASGFLNGGGLDAVLANAGVAVGGMSGATGFTSKELADNLQTNTFGVVNTCFAFLPLLRKGNKKQIFITSSTVGSIGGYFSETPLATAYAMSKAAVNMFAVKLSRELAPEGFTVIPFCPGYVKTDMNKRDGKQEGELEPEEACRLAVKNVFLAAKPEDTAKFMAQDGSSRPW
ncbi:hypothetical protein JCM10212_004962, partial [Sporobolomyces blumeae]